MKRALRLTGLFVCLFLMNAATVVVLTGMLAPASAGPLASENGDVNGDGSINIADPVYLLSHLFDGGPPPVALAGSGLTAQDVALLQDLLPHISIEYPADGTGGTYKTVRFTGVNVQVVNGLGATNGYPTDPTSIDSAHTQVNGLGNLIVGYNEVQFFQTGSHNFVGGAANDYVGFGGLVVGRHNQASGAYATVSGGSFNAAIGDYASVSGGMTNGAVGDWSSVSGGITGTASGDYSSAVGGNGNTASGWASLVGGGASNLASGDSASVTGGGGHDASGALSSISGGQSHIASGDYSSISGGASNQATAVHSAVSGGAQNVASGSSSAVSGGAHNSAPALWSTVSGGDTRTAGTISSWAAGGLFQNN